MLPYLLDFLNDGILATIVLQTELIQIIQRNLLWIILINQLFQILTFLFFPGNPGFLVLTISG